MVLGSVKMRGITKDGHDWFHQPQLLQLLTKWKEPKKATLMIINRGLTYLSIFSNIIITITGKSLGNNTVQNVFSGKSVKH